MFPRRNFKILLIFLIFCSFLLIYSLSLITTKGIVVFSTNNNIIDGSSRGQLPSALIASPHSHSHRFGLQFRPIPQQDAAAASHIATKTQEIANSDSFLQRPAFQDTLFRGDIDQRPDAQREQLNAAVKIRSGDAPESQARQEFLRLQNQYALKAPNHRQSSSPVSTLVKIPYKLVHIDLKGAPPKLSYLKYVLQTVKDAGGNGILLEYEDMFPFIGGGLNGTAHAFHYSQDDINDLIATCNKLGLEIIPLVQTFGHLEFVLKLERFRHLREVDDYPQEICPKNDVAWSLVTALIDQIVSMHKDAQYIHIGCDEVYHIGECTRCHGKDVKELFLGHVRRVASYVREKHGKRSIMWDDMLRKYYVEELIAADIGNYVELMVWDYTEDVDRLVSPYLWPMYGQIFPNIWIASAYKGAFGESLYSVEIERHALNHLSWLRILGREQPRIKNLRGFVITGWSRYDHFAVLCELLPVAIPSMVLSLQLLISQNMDDATKSLYKFLKCDPAGLSRLDDCSWSGADLYSLMKSLHFYEDEAKRLINQHRHEKGWLSDYALKYNYTSPWRLAEPMQMASQYIISIRSYEITLRMNLKNYYEPHVVDEWIEQKIEPIINSLELLISDCKSLSARKSWDRRPPPRPKEPDVQVPQVQK